VSLLHEVIACGINTLLEAEATRSR
jgi:hypothetical protein